jgi:hypothetical protein
LETYNDDVDVDVGAGDAAGHDDIAKGGKDLSEGEGECEVEGEGEGQRHGLGCVPPALTPLARRPTTPLHRVVRAVDRVSDDRRVRYKVEGQGTPNHQQVSLSAVLDFDYFSTPVGVYVVAIVFADFKSGVFKREV